MAARTPPPGLQLSWVDGEAVAWQPGRGVYGGNLHHEVARVSRRPSMAYNGSTRVIPLNLPDGRANVMCQRLDSATLASLGQLDALGADYVRSARAKRSPSSDRERSRTAWRSTKPATPGS